MKYLLVAHYAGFDLDDPEDFVNNSWLVDEAMTETEAVDLATKEINNYVEEQVENRFDEDDDEAEKEDFRNEFETSITEIRIPSEKMETIAHLHYASDFYFEDLKIEVIKIGE